MIRFGTYSLDSTNECVWRETGADGRQRIDLTPKAFAILRHLVKHAGRLVKQEELLQVVWPETHIQPEGLKSQILNIRRSLGDDAKHPQFIETVPRRGYRFMGVPSSDTPAESIQSAKIPRSRLVGRDSALTDLREAFASVQSGQRRIVLVTGEAGIGKTAVVEAFAAEAVQRVPSLRVLRGQCVEGYDGKEPYYPMLQALGDLCRSGDNGQTVDLLARHAPTWLAQFPALRSEQARALSQREALGATRERMLREICDCLEIMARDSPLLVVFEDLQWADNATIDLISAAARHRVPANLLLVATFRSEKALSRDHPLKELKDELIVHGLAQKIALRPLNPGDVAALLNGVPQTSSSTGGLADVLHRHSGGNPMFLVAALEHLHQRGLVSHDSGTWVAALPLEQMVVGVPNGLRHMIEACIERLSAAECQVLEAASVVGLEFSVHVVARAADLDPEFCAEVCDSLSRGYPVVRAADASPRGAGHHAHRFAFVHAMCRDALYERQSPTRRARLHRRIAEYLDSISSGGSSGFASELAHHFERCSDWPAAIRYLRLAASAAMARHAHGEANDLLRHAVALTDNLPEPERVLTQTDLLEQTGIQPQARWIRISRSAFCSQCKGCDDRCVDAAMSSCDVGKELT